MYWKEVAKIDGAEAVMQDPCAHPTAPPRPPHARKAAWTTETAVMEAIEARPQLQVAAVGAPRTAATAEIEPLEPIPQDRYWRRMMAALPTRSQLSPSQRAALRAGRDEG